MAISPSLKSFVVNSLRRASYRWRGRYTALANGKIGRNMYVCAHCPPGVVHPKKSIQLDHIIPCVPVEGWDNFDGFIERLFCETEGYQILCSEHHQVKTLTENGGRKVERTKARKATAAKKVPKPKK
jgi:hypothetical protein